MRDKCMKKVFVWVLLFVLIMGQGNMAFAAPASKPGKPAPQPTSSLDITTINLKYDIPEDQAFEFYVDASMMQNYSVIWGPDPSDDGLLDFADVEKSQKATKKTVTYYEKARFIFTPIDIEKLMTVTYTISASEAVNGTINKDQITVTFNVTPVNSETNAPPKAMSDEAKGKLGSELLIQPLLNDTDPDGDVITLVSVKDEYGTVIPFDGSDIRFTPTVTGTIILYYVISDGKDTAEGTITVIVTGGTFVYVALGDSIPAGYSAEKSLPKIIESYTDKINNTLVNQYDNVEYYDAAISGLNIYHENELSLYDQIMSHSDIRGYITSANLITLCIGANDIMDAAPTITTGRDFYNIDWAKADSGLDNIFEYWDDIINEIFILNSDVELVVMNMYNPYSFSDSKSNIISHEVYGSETMHFLVEKYFYSIEDLNPSKNDGIDYGLNYIIENPDKVYENFTHEYKVVNVYDYFEVNDPTKSTLIAFYSNYVWVDILIFGFPFPVRVLVQDPHPTLLGQTVLYDLHATTMGW